MLPSIYADVRHIDDVIVIVIVPAPPCLLQIVGEWDPAHPISTTVSIPAGDASVATTLTARGVKLWWPNGFGEQPMYNISVGLAFGNTATAPLQIADASTAQQVAAVTASTQRRVGFRYAVLVTGNDTDPAFVKAAATQDGSSPRGECCQQ